MSVGLFADGLNLVLERLDAIIDQLVRIADAMEASEQEE